MPDQADLLQLRDMSIGGSAGGANTASTDATVEDSTTSTGHRSLAW